MRPTSSSFMPQFNFFHDVLFRLRGRDALSYAEMRVCTVVLRRMMLTKREWVRLDHSQFKEYSGLSHQGLYNGIRAAGQRGVLLVQETPNGALYSFAILPGLSVAEELESIEEDDGSSSIECETVKEVETEVKEVDGNFKQVEGQRADACQANGTPDSTCLTPGFNLLESPSFIHENRGLKYPPNGAGAGARASPFSERFIAFWNAWPDHDNKRRQMAAWRAWRELSPNPDEDDGLYDRILSAVEAQKGGRAWNRENRRFIPLPENWLLTGSWNDHVEPWTAARARYSNPNGQKSMDLVEEMQQRQAAGKPAMDRQLPRRQVYAD